MCTELININYSTFKSLCTHCSFQTCLIEEDKLVFAGPPNRGYKDKKRKRPHIENCYQQVFFHLIPSICHSKQAMSMKSYCRDSFKLVNTKKVKAFFPVSQCVAPFIPRQFTMSCQFEGMYPNTVYAAQCSDL